jgi:hypothetical protein
MWRFLLASSFTVCGVVLLFIASMGSSLLEFDRPRALLQTSSRDYPGIQQPQADTAAQPQAGVSAQTQVDATAQTRVDLAAQTPADAAAQTQVDATAQPQAGVSAQPQAGVAAQTQTPADAAAQTQVDLAAQTQAGVVAQQQDDALRQQVQSLQSKLAQATQDITVLRSEADAQKRAADALRQQHDEDKAELSQLKLAKSSQPPGTQQSVAPPADAQTHAAKSTDTAAPAPGVLQSKPPKPPNTSTQNQPKQIASDFSAAQAVIDRLRREPDAVHTAQELPSAPPPRSAQARLSDARTALTAGRIDDARRLLEQAQVQLAFRPVTPEGAIASSGSMAAGDVAEALSMLNAGDVRDALQYIDLAIGQPDGPVRIITDAERSAAGWSRP